MAETDHVARRRKARCSRLRARQQLSGMLGWEISRAGITAHAVDDAVRDNPEQSKFRDLLLHKTGHGRALDVHEGPQLMRGNRQVLLPGTVTTIEHGLYKPGEIGVRIEDNLCMTESDNDCLTEFLRGLTIVG